MKLRQTQVNERLEQITKRGFNPNDFIYNDNLGCTTFYYKEEGGYFFAFDENIPKGYVDPLHFKQYKSRFSPGIKQRTSGINHNDPDDYFKWFEVWLRELEAELEAKKELPKLLAAADIQFNPEEIDDEEAWTSEDEEKIVVTLNQITINIQNFNETPSEFVETIKAQNDSILKEIKLIKELAEENGKVLTKKFVLKSILGGLLNIAIVAGAQYGAPLAVKILLLIMSSPSLLDTAPPQSLTA